MSTDVLFLVAVGAVVIAAVGTYFVKTLKRRK